MLAWLLGLPRPVKRLISVCADMVFLIGALIAAYILTQHDEQTFIPQIALAFAVTLPITLFIFTKLGLYRAVVRYIGQHALGAVLAGILSNAMILVMLFQHYQLHPIME